MTSPDAGGGRQEDVLVLFLSFGVSLQTWIDAGLFSREIALYNAYARTFDRVYLLTYGDEADLKHAGALADNVEVVPKRLVGNDVLYSFLLPLIHRSVLGEATLYKTDQMLGSWAAVLAKILYRVPLVVRTGYVLTDFYDRQEKPLFIRLLARLVEHLAYRAADGIVTSSEFGREYVEKRYNPNGLHRVVPNYIETDVFVPMESDTKRADLCFVGRLAEQKNLEALITAVAAAGFSLTIVGDGPMETELTQLAEARGADVTFAGTVPNHELPELLNQHRGFVLPSLYEGMPKALLEAMACGLGGVGTDVPGINEVITHEKTGLLCGTDARSIQVAIERLLTSHGDRDQLGRAAREYVVANHSLAAYVEREWALFSALDPGLGEPPAPVKSA